MIEAWQGIGERECNQHRSPPLSEVLEIQYSYDTGTIPVQCTILVVPDRYHTGTHGTSTKPVRAVPVLIGTHGTGTGTDAMGRIRQSDRSGQPDRSRTTPSHRSEARGARQGATQPDGKQGQSALGISVGATAVLHVLAAPLDRRHAFLVSRRSIPRSLVACSAVHSLYLHPSRFIIPPSTP